jgi:hypothetical protein
MWKEEDPFDKAIAFNPFLDPIPDSVVNPKEG